MPMQETPEMQARFSGSGRLSGGGNGNPLQYTCLENPMDRRAWQTKVHRVAKSWTWQVTSHTHTHTHTHTIIVQVVVYNNSTGHGEIVYKNEVF